MPVPPDTHSTDRLRPTTGWSLWLLAALFLASPAVRSQETSPHVPGSGGIKGTVTITKPDEKPEDHMSHGLTSRYMTDPAGAELLVNPTENKPYSLSERAVVYLEAVPGGKIQAPTEHQVLEQRGLKFHPEVLPVLVGTTVDFPNGDNLFHNVFSYSQAKEFDLGRYPLGDSRSVLFDKPGVVKVYCDIHSRMSAIILVLENPFFASPDNDGNFTISDIPEGKYRLCLWYSREVVLRRTVTVKTGEITTIALTH